MSSIFLEEKLREAFMKHLVINTKDVYKIIQTSSRTTAYRYLKKLDALSSYSHSGKYYTLKELADFDKYGLWHHGDISFSKYGTLMNTIAHLVTISNSGKSCSELAKQQKVYVQNALLSLVKSKKIAREMIDGVYIYLSTDPDQSKKQIHNRCTQEQIIPVPNWLLIQIFLAIIRCMDGHVSVKKVLSQLKKQGHTVTLDQVNNVFKQYSLEKKTLDSKP